MAISCFNSDDLNIKNCNSHGNCSLINNTKGESSWQCVCEGRLLSSTFCSSTTSEELGYADAIIYCVRLPLICVQNRIYMLLSCYVEMFFRLNSIAVVLGLQEVL